MLIRSLATASEVIDALGGTAAVARLTGRGDQAVSNWRASGRLPAPTYVVMTDALRAIDRTAPAVLWGMAERPANPARRGAEAAS